MWVGPDYTPPRWMSRAGYYAAKRLNRIYAKKVLDRVFKASMTAGAIGIWDSVRFVES